MQKNQKNPMIQFREKSGRTDDTEFIRPHYRASKMISSFTSSPFQVHYITAEAQNYLGQNRAKSE